MFGHYVKIAVRNFARHRMYSIINVGGLALGLSCTILILLWVRDELSFDRFHRNAGAMYRLTWDFKWNGNEGIGPGTPPPLAAALVGEIPDVEAATRVYPVFRQVVRYGDRFFNEGGILAADSGFFRMFDFTLTAGDPARVLAGPNRVVLTEETARKYFGDEDPFGKFLTVGEDRAVMRRPYRSLFVVTGIVKAPPHNSQIQFDMITSMASHPEVAFFDWSWMWMRVVTYIRLRDNVMPASVEAKIPALVKRYAPAAFSRVGFSFLTILIACIGLFGLAAFATEQRTKEIGIRKVLGATERQIVGALSRDFVVLVAAANLAAWPVAWYVMSRWLENFAYRADISWLTFILSGTIALCIALLTVSSHALRAARANPTEALKYE